MTDKPNILFVFSDQHRWCDLGCYGNTDVISPNFDRFAAQGLRFERCISNDPLCVPARGSLLTGLYPLKHGAVTNDLPIRPDVESVAGVLGRAGYHTGYIGKWHLSGVPRDQSVPEEKRLGFKEWKVCNCDHNYMQSYYYDEAGTRHETVGYDAETYTVLAVDFIRRNSGTPWGLWLSWGPPHDPYFQVPRKYLDLYESKKLSVRENVPDKDPGIIGRRARSQTERDLCGYYAHITALDEQFGRLMFALEDSGQIENTIVVYTSDHGDMLGSQGWGDKQLPFDESVRVPLLMRWPGKIRCGVSGELMGLADLPVSLLALVGHKMPDADGTDLCRIFTDERAAGSEACYIFDLIPCHQSAWRGTDAWRGVRTKKYTYACHADGSPYVLFDNERDPFQLENLIHSPAHAAQCEALHQLTVQFAAQHDALLPWQELVKRFGLLKEWNRSQQYFGLPLLASEKEVNYEKR